MRARVPTQLVDNEYENFPEGFYDGNIESAEIKDPNGDGSWLTVKVGFADITPKEGTEDPGRSAFNGDITIMTEGVDARDVEDFTNGDIPFAVRRAGGLLAGLAEGLGVAERDDEGYLDVDIRAVADALTAGEFEGERVGFEVTHYTSKKTDKTYEQFNRFGPAS